MTVTLHLGDCVEVMRSMPDNSVDAIVTDPPYGLGFMGKDWDTMDKSQFGVAGNEGDNDLKVKKNFNILPRYNNGGLYDFCLRWATEALRVLKPGGHLLSFGGTRTYHRMACAIEDAGFEIRDQIQWIYGSGFPKSLDISKAIDKMAGATGEVIGKELVDIGMQSGNMHAGRKSITIERDITAPATPDAVKWQGWGTALKPANEPIVLARKPLIGTVARNVLEWGAGGLNIDGCRVGTRNENESGWSKTGSKASENRSMSGANYERQPKDEIGIGRFPANVIHDGSDEVVAMFPQQKSPSTYTRTSAAHGNIDWNPKESGTEQLGYGDSGSAARFFYCAKASRSERNAGLEGMEERSKPVHIKQSAGRQKAGEMESMPMQNHHPTVKPIALMRYLCKLITPPNGAVLDPFMGSGTTGCAAVQEGFNFIGIERECEYYEIAEKRIADAQQQMRLPM